MESTEVDYPPQRDVLIISTIPLIREVFCDIFVNAGYQCLLAANGREAIEIFRGWRPSLVITDFNLQDMSALELLLDLRREDPEAAVIVLCGDMYKRDGKVVGFLDLEAARSAGLKLGAHAFLQKPVDLEELLLTANGALESRQTTRRRRQALTHHWGAVRPMAAVSELLAVFAAVFTIPPRHESDRGDPVELQRG
jgi:DNA-binding response OmpR family regulator